MSDTDALDEQFTEEDGEQEFPGRLANSIALSAPRHNSEMDYINTRAIVAKYYRVHDEASNGLNLVTGTNVSEYLGVLKKKDLKMSDDGTFINGLPFTTLLVCTTASFIIPKTKAKTAYFVALDVGDQFTDFCKDVMDIVHNKMEAKGQIIDPANRVSIAVTQHKTEDNKSGIVCKDAVTCTRIADKVLRKSLREGAAMYSLTKSGKHADYMIHTLNVSDICYTDYKTVAEDGKGFRNVLPQKKYRDIRMLAGLYLNSCVVYKENNDMVFRPFFQTRFMIVDPWSVGEDGFSKAESMNMYDVDSSDSDDTDDRCLSDDDQAPPPKKMKYNKRDYSNISDVAVHTQFVKPEL